MRHRDRCEDASHATHPVNQGGPTALPRGKSNALRWIEPRIDSALARIPAFITLTLDEWRAAPDCVFERCQARLPASVRLAVRSDARAEDGEQTHAGAFSTRLNVDWAHLGRAISEVVADLGATGDAIIVQAMAQSMRYTGVAATHRIDDGAPWYCIELDASGEPCVTAGRASGRLYAFARDQARGFSSSSSRMTPAATAALRLIMHIEDVVGNVPVEIEFALCGSSDDDLQAELLQVRRFPKAQSRWLQPAVRQGPAPLLPSLAALAERDSLTAVAGSGTVYSLMADWNPAELIGSHPRPLALSLFERLIADGVWWQARSSLGYRAAPSPAVPLLAVLAGRPFVDVRRSANSLLPAALDGDAAERIVRHWLAKLAALPELHDKVEFAVYRTATDFRRDVDVANEYAEVLTGPERAAWAQQLQTLTAAMMTSDVASARPPARAPGGDAVAFVQAAIDTARAFAVVARIAFVAGAQMRSAEARGALAMERLQQLVALASPRDATADPWLLAEAGYDQALRSGMFDIRQEPWRVSQRRFAGAGSGPRDVPDAAFELTIVEQRAIAALLRDANIPLPAVEWLAFAQRATARRECAKRVLGYAIDRVFAAMLADGAHAGMTADDLSWLTLSQWFDGRVLDPEARHRRWTVATGDARRRYQEQSRIITSPVLRNELDRFLADSLGILPNFVGRQTVEGRVEVVTDPASAPRDALRGRVVAIVQADPGYDWLFACNIAGLVTAWGGANSHMAIRCAETGTTAAIGCGEAAFARIAQSTHARIDPQAACIWTP